MISLLPSADYAPSYLCNSLYFAPNPKPNESIFKYFEVPLDSPSSLLNFS